MLLRRFEPYRIKHQKLNVSCREENRVSQVVEEGNVANKLYVHSTELMVCQCNKRIMASIYLIICPKVEQLDNCTKGVSPQGILRSISGSCGDSL